jgi:hypothetical protein
VSRRAAKPVDLTLEREIQADVVDLYQRLGLEVFSFSQHRRGSGTHQTPGIADVKACCVRKHLTWWHEVKTPTGVQSDAQKDFQRAVEGCGEIYLLGGMEVALIHLQAIGLLGAGGVALLQARRRKGEIARILTEVVRINAQDEGRRGPVQPHASVHAKA